MNIQLNLRAFSLMIVALFVVNQNSNAVTGDVIDDFLYYGMACNGYANAVWADVDGDGSWDTQVVITTINGEGEVNDVDPSDKEYFFTFQSALSTDCSYASEDRGRLVIHFVDINAPGFDMTDPATWTYIGINYISIKAEHDHAVRPGATPGLEYQLVQAYEEMGQSGEVTGVITPIAYTLPFSFIDQYDFTNETGIKELYISTDFAENSLDDLILGNELIPGIISLFDLSGSMTWSHEGIMGVPESDQRLTFAKNASLAFTDLLYLNFADEVNMGIAGFPPQPWIYGAGCNGQEIFAVDLLSSANYTTITTSTIPNLTAAGNTPLLAGMQNALGMFGDEMSKAIVLLSDGYHNCPSTITLPNSEVNNLVDDLNDEGISVYTIGFGRPTDVDHPLLEELASQTGGEFYDVTGDPGFDPSWDPAVTLDATYAKILADGLDLDFIADPQGQIAKDEEIRVKIPVNQLDAKVSFHVSWKMAQQKYIDVQILSSDGNPLPVRQAGITYKHKKNFTIVSVDSRFLKFRGKVTDTPWELVLSGKNIQEGKEPYQYNVLTKSKVKLHTWFDKGAYNTGEQMLLSLEVLMNNKRIKDLEKITIDITKPEDGLGNWLANNKVDPSQIMAAREKWNIEKLNLVQLKSKILVDEMKVAYPGRIKAKSIEFHDDGKNGDREAGDGIYVASFGNLDKEGNYIFNISVAGKVKEKLAFERQAQLQQYVNVDIDLGNLLADIIDTQRKIKGQTIFNIKLMPKDNFGNIPYPSFMRKVELSLNKGCLKGDLIDNMDGTYTQKVVVPGNIDPADVDIKISVGQQSYVQKIDEGSQSWLNKYVTVRLLLIVVIVLLLLVIIRRRKS